ncbi:GNAT family N-acetyltransferase [Nonlabens arenilitoris]|uniref:GNAT family N-acetyltransferase n=1 Tax=Nonlabens arenilitoris TaxID=1217969 RepID=A0A2S7UAJ5_9FLAO|nr:GNAT family N-acetyltransferase [Nonlabens arenilitoris]PQJ31650.1 GNAT family N-acetyltransferase [Nonlabens arenilitoris]
MRLVRTDTHNTDFKKLVKELDAYLAVTDGNEHEFYDQFNKLNLIKHVVLCYKDSILAGCGSIKEYDHQSMEIKRMYTVAAYRNKGVATYILKELEQWAKELSYNRCILETGTRQLAAIALYKNSGYQIIDNYEPYRNVLNSVCFERIL